MMLICSCIIRFSMEIVFDAITSLVGSGFSKCAQEYFVHACPNTKAICGALESCINSEEATLLPSNKDDLIIQMFATIGEELLYSKGKEKQD